MISKPLDTITSGDLDALVREQVREGKTIDYKRELPGGKDADKKELLADVSSFANTAGGDLIIGVEEADGVPSEVIGVADTDVDAVIQRLDQIVIAGIAPRLRYAIRAIPVAQSRHVLVIRVERSWQAPHRVIFGGHDKFYARHSTGKYALDVAELRDAFLGTAALPDKIRHWRQARIENIISGQTPVPLKGGGTIVLHLIPAESVASPKQLDVGQLYDAPDKFQPMYGTAWNRRYNLHGVLAHTGDPKEAAGYTQVFRNGIFEATEGWLLNRDIDGRIVIPTMTFEQKLMQATGGFLNTQRELGIEPPIYVFVSLLGAKDRWMGTTDSFFDLEDRYPIRDEVLLLPEAVVETYDLTPVALLRPTFDLVWNACGYPRSENFDTNGDWKPRVR